ncbi:MAG: hypothetical protein RIB84_21215 [Sneathiellaceae bacterium]
MTDFALDGFASTDDAAAGAVLQVRRDDGAPALAKDGTPITLTLMGADSPRFQRVMQDFQERLLKELSRTGRRGGVPQEELADRAVKALAVVTLGWSGILDRAGAPVPVTEGHAAALYRAYPSIREQADRFVNDRANFTPRSATPSAPMPSTSSPSTRPSGTVPAGASI